MFPLNTFLTQNIYRVTTFLREISVCPSQQIASYPAVAAYSTLTSYSQVPPDELDVAGGIESYDFGSCVALHRFLYDHWDQVRQKLVTHERRDYINSPAEMATGHLSVLGPLRSLITNLGPPPLAVTWNRPQLSINPPPSYSRFQDFMLRNAFRSSESFVTARAVYDGGESKVCLSTP